MPVIREEQWTTNLGGVNGMVSTVLVEVRDGDKVWVADSLLAEFDLDTTSGELIPDSLREVEVWSFPYHVVSTALRQKGWARAVT